MKIGYANFSINSENQDKLISELKGYGCSEVYHDKYPAHPTMQTELEYCLKALREGDTLVSWSIEHLTITVSSLMYLLEVLKQKQIGLLLIKDNLSISQRSWDKELRTLNVFFNFLTFANSVNTSLGIGKARKLGKNIGRPPKLSKDEEQNIRTLFESKEASAIEIAKKYDVSRATVYRIVG